MTNKLCEYEMNLLRHCNGEEISGLSWGAAMSVALEYLESDGLIESRSGSYKITQKGIDKINDTKRP